MLVGNCSGARTQQVLLLVGVSGVVRLERFKLLRRRSRPMTSRHRRRASVPRFTSAEDASDSVSSRVKMKRRTSFRAHASFFTSGRAGRTEAISDQRGWCSAPYCIQRTSVCFLAWLRRLSVSGGSARGRRGRSARGRRTRSRPLAGWSTDLHGGSPYGQSRPICAGPGARLLPAGGKPQPHPCGKSCSRWSVRGQHQFEPRKVIDSHRPKTHWQSTGA